MVVQNRTSGVSWGLFGIPAGFLIMVRLRGSTQLGDHTAHALRRVSDDWQVDPGLYHRAPRSQTAPLYHPPLKHNKE